MDEGVREKGNGRRYMRQNKDFLSKTAADSEEIREIGEKKRREYGDGKGIMQEEILCKAGGKGRRRGLELKKGRGPAKGKNKGRERGVNKWNVKG